MKSEYLINNPCKRRKLSKLELIVGGVIISTAVSIGVYEICSKLYDLKITDIFNY